MLFWQADAAFVKPSSITKNVSVEMQATEIDEEGRKDAAGFLVSDIFGH